MSFSILMLNNINAVQQVVLIVIDLNLKILNDNMLININLLSWYHSAYWNWQFAEQHQFIKIDVNQHPLLRQKWRGDFDTFFVHILKDLEMAINSIPLEPLGFFPNLSTRYKVLKWRILNLISRLVYMKAFLCWTT